MKYKLISFLLALVVLSVSCNSQNTQQILKPAAFQEKMNTTPEAVILDVRTPGEYDGGYIANAININYNDPSFEGEIAKLDKSKTYLLYCLSGKRSGSAMDYMLRNGFKNVSNLEGGILAWQSANLALTTAGTVVKKDKITMEMYQQMIHSDTVVLVDFFAPWCAPCIKMKPMLEEVSAAYAGKVKVIRLDIDENKGLAKQLNVTEIPILKTFVKGKETWKHNGYIDKSDLEKQLQVATSN